MDLSKILSIAGKPGLYQIISQSRGGVVAKSLIDGKKMSIGQTLRVSTLSDISIYVEDGDEPLYNVLKQIHENYGEKKLDIDQSDSDALRGFLREILPEHDEERVYTSDIKKVIKWYNMLLENDLLDFTEEEKEASEGDESADAEAKEEESKVEEAVEDSKPAPKKKAPAKE